MNVLLHWYHRRPTLTVALLFLLLGLVFFAGVLIPPQGQVMAGHDMIGNYYIYWQAQRKPAALGA